MHTRDYVHLSVNGKLHKIRGHHAFSPLSDFLRYELGLTGTKIVCAEGDCGACTVLYRKAGSSSTSFHSINSCIATALLLDGCHLVTVEGLGSHSALSEIQASMVRNFGGQCGFCTPGFVMSIANLYEHKRSPSRQNIKNYLTGNLCRCTGYTPIIEAALDIDGSKVPAVDALYDFETIGAALETDLETPILIDSEEEQFYAPTTLPLAADYKLHHPNARIFSGATDVGVQINKGKHPGARRMSLHLIPELTELKQEGEWIRVGARVNLADLQRFLEPRSPRFAEFLNIFASPQIKNAATLVGNIANGSPIADTTPYLLTADAVVELFHSSGQRAVPLVDFITGYKTFDLREGEFISAIRFKTFSEKTSKIGLYKVSQRRDLDISCVNSSFVLSVDKDQVIRQARLAYGGVGPKAIRLVQVEKEITGQRISAQLDEGVRSSIAKAIAPISDVRGSAEFRAGLCQDLFSKYLREHFAL